MSAGRPVVATPVAAAGLETFAGKGLTVAAEARSFCTALVKYLKNPDLRSTAGKAAVRLVEERYDNRSLTAGLLEFYMKLAHDS